MDTMNKQKAKTILANIVKDAEKKLASAGKQIDYFAILDIIECRYLAKNNAMETATKTGYNYNVVVDVLKTVKQVTKGKTLAYFA